MMNLRGRFRSIMIMKFELIIRILIRNQIDFGWYN